uniref:SS18L1 subunit of BAF chromatin remodeling complex n=1 Tax=Petromyzon marinus TaxID=7757 RepID=S4R987_PETMA
GPNSMAMQPPNHQASPALSLPASSHATMGYSHSVPSSGPGGPSQAYRTPPASQGQGENAGSENTGSENSSRHMVSQQPAPSQYNLAQGSGQHYQGMMGGGAGQGSQMMGQRQMPGYSRSAQQGPPQQFGSQDDYYAEQYSHGQPPADGMTPQYYPDRWYGEPRARTQTRSRAPLNSSLTPSLAGTGQYGQQQGSYQPGPPAQTYPSQQQFGGPQGYPSQGQGYAGPAQTGSGQYAGYPQGQQYGAYRPPQPGPPTPQQQRPYGYEQGQYGAYQQ